MHFTLPWYVGSSALSVRRLSPSTIRLSCRFAFRLSPFERTGVSSWYGAPRWKFSTKTRPLNWSDGMAGCVQRRSVHPAAADPHSGYHAARRRAPSAPDGSASGPRSEAPAAVVPRRATRPRTRPAATSATPSTAARPTGSPRPPRRPPRRRTAKRRSGPSVPPRDDSDRAKRPARAPRPCAPPRGSRCSAPGPGNCAMRSARRPSSPVRSGRPAVRHGRIRAPAPSGSRTTSSMIDQTACVRKVNHRSDTRSAAWATRRERSPARRRSCRSGLPPRLRPTSAAPSARSR